MSVATKKELEDAIAAIYNDLCVNIDKAVDAKDWDEADHWRRRGLIEARELVGIVVKTYRINIPEIDNEETEK